MPEELGTPKNRVGTRAPPSLALLAASGAMTPASAPCPYGTFDGWVWRAWP